MCSDNLPALKKRIYASSKGAQFIVLSKELRVVNQVCWAIFPILLLTKDPIHYPLKSMEVFDFNRHWMKHYVTLGKSLNPSLCVSFCIFNMRIIIVRLLGPESFFSYFWRSTNITIKLACLAGCSED